MVVNSKFLHRCIDTQMFFFHGFYNHFLELRRISFVWYSFWHSKTPHLLDSISYCLTNGVLFKNLYRTFILYYWYYMIKVSSVPSFQRRNKATPVKPLRCAPEWRHPWRCSQPWCSRRPSCQRCAGRHPARRSRRFQWRQPQRPCQSCSAASWRRKGCRQSG